MDGASLIRWIFASGWSMRWCREGLSRRAGGGAVWRRRSARRSTGWRGSATTGSVAPGQMGGHRPKKLIGA